MTFERAFLILTKPVVFILFLFLMVVCYCYFDKAIAYYFHQTDVHALLSVFKVFAFVGESYVWVSLLFLLALFYRFVYKNKKWEQRLWFLWSCVFIPNAISAVLKISLGRARPGLLFESQLFGFYGPHLKGVYWSFPSGHTTTIMGLMLGFSIIYPNHVVTWSLVGLLVATMRIVLTEHYLSDVLTTAYLVFIEIGLLNYFFKRQRFFPLVYR